MPRGSTGLLNTTSATAYKDPRASILLGSGNPSITDDQIRKYANSTKDSSQVLGAALSNNVSIPQYAKAMGVPESVYLDYVKSQGIDLTPTANKSNNTTNSLLNQSAIDNTGGFQQTVVPQTVVPQTVAPPPVVTEEIKPPKNVSYDNIQEPTPVSFSPAAVSTRRVNPGTETVQGQLIKMIDDPNNPLFVTARTQNEQYANKKGLLNSSLGAEAAYKAMIDSALDIAAPDAATYSNTAADNMAAQNQNSMFNSQYGLLADQINSENALKANMFNADNALKTNMYNADNRFRTDTFNADLSSRLGMFNNDLSSRLGMFNNDLSSKVGMFNTGTAADILNRREANQTSILNNRESLENSRLIAELDTDTKLAIAGIQQRSADSGHAAGIFDTLMRATQTILGDPNIPANDKQDQISQLTNQATSMLGLLDTIDATGIGEKLDFSNNQNMPDQGNNTNQPNSASLLPDGSAKSITNIAGAVVPKKQVELVQNMNQIYGTRVDPRRIATEAEYVLTRSGDGGVVIDTQNFEPFMYPAKGGMAPTGVWLHKA